MTADFNIHSQSTQSKPHYVYFVGSESHYVKIGVTSNLPERLKTLQNANHERLQFLFAFRCPDMVSGYALEADFHNFYADYGVINEWFNADRNAISESVERLLLMWIASQPLHLQSTAFELVFSILEFGYEIGNQSNQGQIANIERQTEQILEQSMILYFRLNEMGFDVPKPPIPKWHWD